MNAINVFLVNLDKLEKEIKIMGNEKLTKTNGCFFVINPAYDEKDLSSKRYIRMSFSTVGNKIDQKTLKAEYSDDPDFRKDKNKWYINLFKKLRKGYEHVWKTLQGMR